MDILMTWANLILAGIAAIFAVLTYIRPRGPKKPAPPKFTGDIETQAQELADFLAKRDGDIVELAIDLGFPNKAPIEWVDDGDNSRAHLKLPANYPEGDVVSSYLYRIGDTSEVRAIRRGAGGLELKGFFTAHVGLAFQSGVSFGALKLVGSLEVARLRE